MPKKKLKKMRATRSTKKKIQIKKRNPLEKATLEEILSPEPETIEAYRKKE